MNVFESVGSSVRRVALWSLCAGFACGAGVAWAALPAGYVQEGLIACWDGIDNAGTGTHDPDAMTWVDLVNGRVFTLNGIGQAKGPTVVNADCVTFSGQSGSYGVMSQDDSDAVFKYIGYASGTVEVLVKADSVGSSAAVLAAPGYVQLGPWNATATIIRGVSYTLAVDLPWTTTATNTFSLSYAPYAVWNNSPYGPSTKAGTFDDKTLHFNGVAQPIGSTTCTWSTSDTKPAVIGAGQGRTSGLFAGSIYAIRVYNRKLETHEVLANRFADQARFMGKVHVPETAGIRSWTGETVVADLPETPWYSVTANAGGIDVGSYPVVLSLKDPANTVWEDGTTADKTIYFKIKNPVTLTPAEDAETNYQNITAAIASAEVGDTILLSSGTYPVEKTIWIEKGVILKGASRDSVILNFNGKCRGFVIRDGLASLRDLTVYKCASSVVADIGNTAAGGGVFMTGGTLSNCLFKACSIGCYSGGRNVGAGVFMTRGRVVDCEFADLCYADSTSARGNALAMDSGVASGCDVHACRLTRAPEAVYLAGGVFRDSKVYDNTGTAGNNGCAGIGIDQGLVYNCLVYGNKTSASGAASAGLIVKNGSVYYTTVWGNVKASDTTGVSGLSQTGGTVMNSIIYGNGPDTCTEGSSTVSGGVFERNVVDSDKVLATYPNNKASDPKFVDTAANDFHLASSASSAYGYAEPVWNVTNDYDGAARAAEPSCGCYEFDAAQEPFGVDIKFTATEFRVGTPVTVEASVAGASAADVDLSWYLDGELINGETDVTLTLADLSIGRHSLKIRGVKKSGGESDEKDYPDCIAIRTTVAYVNTTGSGMYPYDTAEKGTNSFAAVMAALWTEPAEDSVIHVAAGSYTNAVQISVTGRIRILGEGAGVAFVTNPGLSDWVFSLANEHAEVTGITVRNSGKAFAASAGSIHDCRAVDIKTGDTDSTGVGFHAAGTAQVWNCVASNCWANGLYSGGGCFSVGGSAVVSNVLAVAGRAQNAGNGNGGSVWVQSGKLIRATIVGTKVSNEKGAALHMSGGEAWDCIVTGNTCTNNFVVSLDGSNPKLVNCLIANNRTEGGVAINAAKGTIENCTFAANESPETTFYASADVSAWNSIFAETATGTNALLGAFSHCCAPSLENGVDGNVSADPCFKNAARGNFRLRQSSPCIDAGDNARWENALNPLDLDAQPRIYRREKGGIVDMGCYEYRWRGLILMVE